VPFVDHELQRAVWPALGAYPFAASWKAGAVRNVVAAAAARGHPGVQAADSRCPLPNGCVARSASRCAKGCTRWRRAAGSRRTRRTKYGPPGSVARLTGRVRGGSGCSAGFSKRPRERAPRACGGYSRSSGQGARCMSARASSGLPRAAVFPRLARRQGPLQTNRPRRRCGAFSSL